MSLAKLSGFLQFFVCGPLLCTGIASAQSADRILTFDSKITVDRDRTMHRAERFEIANETGFFDSGFHRQLWIKHLNPQRVKVGPFQSVAVRVDGHDAVVRTSEERNALDIGIATETGTLSRGNHVIELSYTAKHQFAIYDDFEDLNQDISGEWPVTIERATVELSFPGELPKEAGVSADTGTDSDFKFDCVRTNLPSGVRFETTHSLSYGIRLFISARFPHPGYFVSNFKEDGFRAILENHPLLFPWLAFLSGLIVFTAIGFLAALQGFRIIGATWAVPTDHRVATTVAAVATVLSTSSLFVLREPYTAMPGFMLGAITSIGISGNPHGGEPFSLVLVGVTGNLVFYYLVARGLGKIGSSRTKQRLNGR
jgi:Predicted membrane protein (DUF2207)